MTSIPSEKTYKSKLQNAEECAEIFYSEAVFKTKQPAKTRQDTSAQYQ